MTIRWNVILISHVIIVPSAVPKLWRNTMLSLQDSVFFEISIKSLLKSWSSSCEYPAKLELMFTFFTSATRLISYTQQGDTLQHYMYACSEIMLRGFLFPPCKRKVVINGVVRMTDDGSPGLFHVYAGCSGSLLVPHFHRSTGSWLSRDMLLLMNIVEWIKELFKILLYFLLILWKRNRKSIFLHL